MTPKPSIDISKLQEEKPLSFIEKAGKFFTKTGLIVAKNVVDTVDFVIDTTLKRAGQIKAGDLPPFFKELPGRKELTVEQAKTEKKIEEWNTFFEANKEKLPAEKAKVFLDELLKKEAFQPTKKWQEAPLKEKFNKENIGETIMELAPSVVASIGSFVINPTFGFATIAGATATDIKDTAEEYGVDPDDATKYSIYATIPIMLLEKIVPAKILGSKQIQQTFFKGLLRRLFTAGKLGSIEAGTEMTQEAIQIAMESTFRDDLSWDEIKTREVMAGVGGVGGGTGMSILTSYMNTPEYRNELAELAKKVPIGMTIEEVGEKPEIKGIGRKEDPLTKEAKKAVAEGKSVEFAKNTEGVATRFGRIKEGGAYFSTANDGFVNKNYFNRKTSELFDIKKANIVESDTVQMTKVFKKALENKTNTPQDIIRLKREINSSIENSGRSVLDWHGNDEIPSIVKAAKELGYDGIKVIETGDTSKPTSVFIWNTKKVAQLTDIYNKAKAEPAKVDKIKNLDEKIVDLYIERHGKEAYESGEVTETLERIEQQAESYDDVFLKKHPEISGHSITVYHDPIIGEDLAVIDNETNKIVEIFTKEIEAVEAELVKKPKEEVIEKKVITEKVQKATGVELVKLREDKKEMLDNFMKTEEGARIEIEIDENINLVTNKSNENVVSGIKNNKHYRKEQNIKDDMGSGFLMQKGKKFVVVESKDIEEYEDNGFVKNIEIDSLAKEAGFDNGEDYLIEQIEIADLEVNFRKSASDSLLESSKSYENILVRLGEIKAGVRGKKVTMEKYLKELGINSRTKTRRRKVSVIKDFFGLTDRELKSISQKDIAYMTDPEFNEFLNDISARAFEFSVVLQKRNEIMDLINTKDLKKTENLRKSMKLPLIDKMSDEQLDIYYATLAQYSFDDMFLPTRMLETIDRTKLKDRKTYREVREFMVETTGKEMLEFENVLSKEADRFKYDGLLAQENALYELILKDVYTEFAGSEQIVVKRRDEVNYLAKRARKSKKRSFFDRISPTDERVISWLESKNKVELAKEMTDDELAYANYLKTKWEEMYEYLVLNEYLGTGIDNYYAHIRRGFTEAMVKDGFTSAVGEMFKSQEVEALKFEIMDSQTGEVLPMEKFFANSLKRTGKLVPTQDSARAFITYMTNFEKMRAINTVTPLVSAYTLVSTPQKTTNEGLLLRGDINRVIKEWLNNKRGRKHSLGGIVKQGGKLDRSIRFARAVITVKDLGLSIPVGVASTLGEQVATFRQMGIKKHALSKKRRLSKKGQAIIKKYESFVGETLWKDLTQAGRTTGNKLMTGMFSLFHISTRMANIDYLLGSMTNDEFNQGELSNERLAELKLEMGTFRAISDMKSIVGSTSVGSAFTQYKSWAIPLAVSVTKDLKSVSVGLAKKEFKNVWQSKELKRTFNSALITILGILGSAMLPDDDDTLIGKTIQKAKREIITILQALSPRTLFSTPRLISWIDDMSTAINTWVKLEKYADSNKEKAGELKGPPAVWRQLKPSAINLFEKQEQKPRKILGKVKRSSGGLKGIGR